jgi:predicted  nucleic acid-binding Zn ribbon protein
MRVGSNSKSVQYLFEKDTKRTLFANNLENEIECPRCHDVMTLCSDFDFLYYKCEECHLPLYTTPNSDCQFS